MERRNKLNRMLGAATLAMLFGTASAFAQTGAAAGAAGAAATSSAQPGAKQGEAGKSTLSKADQNLMREMAYSNLAEIAAGKVALEKSKNDQVKSFAQKMIDDHTQAHKELEQLAQAKGVTLPTEPDRKHQDEMKKLSALEGDKFDKQYIAQGGLRDHRNTHRLLERAQNRAQDPDLKAQAAKMTPIVDQHLKLAQDMQPGKGTTSGSSSGQTGTSGTSGGSDSSTDTGKSGAAGTDGSSSSGGSR